MKAALRSALSDHAQAGTIALLDAVDVRRAVDEGRPPSCSPTGARTTPTRHRRHRGRGRDRRSRSAISSACSSRVPSELEVAQVVWARSLLVSQARARRGAGEGAHEPASVAGADPPRRLGEELRADRARTSTRSRCTRMRTRRRSARPSSSSSTSRSSASNIVKVQPKPKRRGAIRGIKPGWKKAVVQLRKGDTIEIFEGAQL